jgi:adenosylmethionine-8-amino-7-oxononanoate aminotransferase
VTTHGHGHPRLVAAVQAQTEKLCQTIFANFTHAAAEDFVQEMGRAAAEFGHVFLSDSGSTANEVALKMALGAWHHRGHAARNKIIAFDHGYHGATLGATSLGARGVFSKPHEALLFDVIRLPSPAVDAEKCLDALKKLLAEKQNEIAALMIEPLVQGAGGMKFYAPAVLDSIVRAVQARDVIVIFDEVMTGFGRTGSLFAYQQCREVPDIITLAKGITGGLLPMGATLARREVFDAFYADDRARMLFHSTSYTGNALACAAAAENLRVWRDENTDEKLRQISAWHQQLLPSLGAYAQVKNPRVLGTLAAFEIMGGANDYLADIGPRLMAFALERGVLLRPLGNTVYIMPPYCSTQADLEKVYAVLTDFISSAA